MRPGAERLKIIAGINGEESAGRGINFAGLENDIGWNVDGSGDAAIGQGLHGNGKNQRERFNVADGDANVANPKSDNGNAATGAAEIVAHGNGEAVRIFLCEFCGNAKDFIFAPGEAGAKKGGHIIGSSVAAGNGGVEDMLLKKDAVEFNFLIARVAECSGEKSDFREIIVDFQGESFRETGAGAGALYFDVFSELANFSRGLGDGRVSEIKRKIVDEFSGESDVLTGMIRGVIEGERLASAFQCSPQITGRRKCKRGGRRFDEDSCRWQL